MKTRETFSQIRSRDMLAALIGVYWSIAFAEGQQGRDHDDESGSAQSTWSEIERLIAEAKWADD